MDSIINFDREYIFLFQSVILLITYVFTVKHNYIGISLATFVFSISVWVVRFHFNIFEISIFVFLLLMVFIITKFIYGLFIYLELGTIILIFNIFRLTSSSSLFIFDFLFFGILILLVVTKEADIKFAIFLMAICLFASQFYSPFFFVWTILCYLMIVYVIKCVNSVGIQHFFIYIKVFWFSLLMKTEFVVISAIHLFFPLNNDLFQLPDIRERYQLEIDLFNEYTLIGYCFILFLFSFFSI